MDKKGSLIDQNAIFSQLNNLFIKRFELDLLKDNGKFLDKHLLGIEIGLRARDLLYLYFDIINTFEIEISQEDISAGKFSTYNNIAHIIISQLEHKSLQAV